MKISKKLLINSHEFLETTALIQFPKKIRKKSLEFLRNFPRKYPLEILRNFLGRIPKKL